MAVGRSPSQINQWLSGHRKLDIKGSRLMEEKLGLPAGYFQRATLTYTTAQNSDAKFVHQIQQEVARYEVPDVIKDAIIGMIRQQPEKHAGSSLGDHPNHDAKAA
jgi:transcriptional regulator with XRE-family HTH domain